MRPRRHRSEGDARRFADGQLREIKSVKLMPANGVAASSFVLAMDFFMPRGLRALSALN